MTWKTGTAAGFVAFLDQLQAFLCDAGQAFGRAYTGTGNGTLTGTTGAAGGYVGGPDSLAETFTITATSATAFNVVGSVSGSIGPATVGVAFDHPKVKFRLNAGGTAFVPGDEFKLSTCPPWTLTRRHGVRGPAQRTTNMVNGDRLWDRQVGNFNPATRSGLPATAAIQMIGTAEVRRVSVAVADNPDRMPTAFRLEWSDNGAAWTEAQAWAGVEFIANERREFMVDGSPGAHAYWRLVVSAVGSGTDLELAEVAFWQGVNTDVELSARGEWIVSGPGSDGADTIFVGLELYEDAALAARSFNFYQFRAYDPLRSVRTQGANSGLRNVPLSSNNFTWWVAANGRRFVGVAKIGAVYVPFYQGLGKPYELPSVHPYPAVNAGTSDEEQGVATSPSANFRGFSSPGRYGLVARYPDNVWRVHANRYQSSSDVGDGDTQGKVYPAAMDAQGTEPDFRENLDGTRQLYEIVLAHVNPRHLWGELDGCYWSPGFNLVPESTITMDGFSHLVFQNTFRSGLADFFAIRQD